MSSSNIQPGVADAIAAARQQAERARLLPRRDERLAAVRAALSDTPLPMCAPNKELPEALLEDYQVVGEAHRGGQGVVYSGVQKSTGRRVAIKVMHERPFTAREDFLRFEREVRILAQLDHPNIVGIVDSGVSRGMMYFVMDYVEGQSLGEWVKLREDVVGGIAGSRSSTGGRAHEAARKHIDECLRMFEKICDAVHAAHLRGIIHRDLKPGNIQVDRLGEPHVLDFGMAKWDSGMGDSSFFAGMTQDGRFMGSLPWASPEHAAGQLAAVDVRSDVYALGVVLYQMLTGGFPYDVMGNLPDVLRNVQHAPPTRVRMRNRAVDDELETIVLQALQKEPERRYQSVGAMADDVRRYLAGEPIAAKRDALPYILRKQLRRHALALGVAVGFALLLGVGLAVSLGLWRRADSERAEAQSARQVAETQRNLAQNAQKESESRRRESDAVADFLQNLLESAEPVQGHGADYSVLQLLDEVDARLADEWTGDPHVQARIHLVLGRAYRQLSQFDKSDKHLHASLAILQRSQPADNEEVLNVLTDIGVLQSNQSKWPEAERTFASVYNTFRGTRGENDPQCLRVQHRRAEALARGGSPKLALPMLRRVLELARQEKDLELLASGLHSLGMLLDDLADKAADAAYQESIDINRQLHLGAHPDTVVGLVDLAQRHLARNELDAARPLLDEALAMGTQVYGPNHVKVAQIQVCLGDLARRSDKLDEAESLLRSALKTHLATVGEESELVANLHNVLGMLLNDMGRFNEARQELRHAAAISKRIAPTNELPLSGIYSNLAKAEFGLKRYDAAETQLRKALAIDERNFSPDHPRAVDDRRGLSHVLDAKGDMPGAIDMQRGVLASNAKTSPGGIAEEKSRGRLSDLLARHGHASLARGEPSAAEAALRECLALRLAIKDYPAWRVGMVECVLADALHQQHRDDETSALFARGWARLLGDASNRAAEPTPAPSLADAAARYAAYLRDTGQATLAAEVLATVPSAEPAATASQPSGGN